MDEAQRVHLGYRRNQAVDGRESPFRGLFDIDGTTGYLEVDGKDPSDKVLIGCPYFRPSTLLAQRLETPKDFGNTEAADMNIDLVIAKEQTDLLASIFSEKMGQPG